MERQKIEGGKRFKSDRAKGWVWCHEMPNTTQRKRGKKRKKIPEPFLNF